MVDKSKYKGWLESVKIDHNALLEIPKEYWTDELCLEAVKTDYSILGYLEKKHLTKEICVTAYLKSPGGAIRYVADEIKDVYWKFVDDFKNERKEK